MTHSKCLQFYFFYNMIKTMQVNPGSHSCVYLGLDGGGVFCVSELKWSAVDAGRILPKCLPTMPLPGFSPAVGSEGKRGARRAQTPYFFRVLSSRIQSSEIALKGWTQTAQQPAAPQPLLLHLQGPVPSNPAEWVSNSCLITYAAPCRKLSMLVRQNPHV